MGKNIILKATFQNFDFCGAIKIIEKSQRDQITGRDGTRTITGPNLISKSTIVTICQDRYFVYYFIPEDSVFGIPRINYANNFLTGILNA